MKRKIVTVLLMCALSVNFSACGNNNTDSSATSKTSENQNEDATNADESSEPENPESEESQEDADNAKPDGEDAAPEEEPKPEESPETIYNIGDSALLKDWNINVTDAQTVDSISSGYIVFSPKEEGNKFLQVYVTVENKGKQADNFLPSFGLRDDVSAKVLYSDGYEFSATNLLGYDNELHDSSINPLSSQTGEIAFEIPSTVADSADELLIEFSSGNDKIKFKIR